MSGQILNSFMFTGFLTAAVVVTAAVNKRIGENQKLLVQVILAAFSFFAFSEMFSPGSVFISLIAATLPYGLALAFEIGVRGERRTAEAKAMFFLRGILVLIGLGVFFLWE